MQPFNGDNMINLTKKFEKGIFIFKLTNLT